LYQILRKDTSWNTSLSLRVIWNNLLKDFQYLPSVKSCHPLLTVGAIAVSNPTPQFVTDAMHFAWIGLFGALQWSTLTTEPSEHNTHFKVSLFGFKNNAFIVFILLFSHTTEPLRLRSKQTNKQTNLLRQQKAHFSCECSCQQRAVPSSINI